MGVWPTTKFAALLCVVGLIAGACGSDGVDAAPSRTSPDPPATTNAAATATTTRRSPSPAAIVEFLGADFTPELGECVSSAAPDSTEIAIILGVIECDFDTFYASMVDVMALADPTPIREFYGLTAEEADAFAGCAADEVLAKSVDQFRALAAESPDAHDFGRRTGELAIRPCVAALVKRLELQDAPLLDVAVRTILGDNTDWLVTHPIEVGGGLSVVLIENDVVSIGISSSDRSSRLISVEISFDTADVGGSGAQDALDSVLGLLNLQLDPAIVQGILREERDLELGTVTICTRYSGLETDVVFLKTAIGCDQQ